jgi:hypothetical protein
LVFKTYRLVGRCGILGRGGMAFVGNTTFHGLKPMNLVETHESD